MSFFQPPVSAKMSPCNTLGAENTPFVAVETVLVTGGRGFIGSHTSKEQLTRGYRVVVVDELNNYYDIRIQERNLRELKSWGAAEDQFSFLQRGHRGREVHQVLV